MADNGFSIKIELGDIINVGGVITSSVLPRVHEAIGAIAEQARQNWADGIMKAPGIWSEEKKAYAASLRWDYVSDFHARVTTDYDKATQIENGRPARDLKVMLNTSQKVRRTESGKRFLVIPLRHNTTGNSAHAQDMPQAVMQMAKQLAPSRVVSQGVRPSGEVTTISPGVGMMPSKNQTPFASNIGGGAMMVQKNNYQWGGRLTRSDMKAAGVSAADRKRYAGMYRFDTTGAGGTRSSTYLTFRIMSEDSSGWIIPAKPGLHIVQDVVVGLNPVAEQVLAQAVKLDLS